MSTEENKALVRSFYEEVFNNKNLASVDAFVDPHIIEHDLPLGLPVGIEGTRKFIGMYLAAFPDLRITAEDMVAEGDRVMVRFTLRGTHKGELMGIAPTGKQVTITGIQILRVASGKIVENWVNLDALGLLQQLGVLPPMG